VFIEPKTMKIDLFNSQLIYKRLMVEDLVRSISVTSATHLFLLYIQETATPII